MTFHELSRADARRIAVRAQLLGGSRPARLLDVVRRLTLLQLDPAAAIAPSADLVAWSRLGSSYSPAELAAALGDRTLLELRAMIRPGEDLALYRADMAQWAGARRGQQPGWRASQRDWVRANDACRRDMLDRLGSGGPLPSRDFPDTAGVLRVHAVHQDVPATETMTAAIGAEIEDLARWLGLDLAPPGRRPVSTGLSPDSSVL